MGLNQAEFAERAGIGQATLQDLEGGKGNPTVEILLTVGRFIEKPLVDLAPDDPNELLNWESPDVWKQGSRVFDRLGRISPGRRAAVFYLLFGDIRYCDMLSQFPNLDPLYRALQKLPLKPE